MPKDITPPFSLDSITFDAAGLVPVIAQEHGSGRVLMLAYANRAALEATLETGRGTYFSRSRSALWVKGEESGHTQKVLSVTLDCDGDAVLYVVEQVGDACHKPNQHSCFHNSLQGESPNSNLGAMFGEVYATILDRIKNPKENSYVSKLHAQGLDRILKKIGEEAGEVIIAAKNRDKAELQLEASDLFFHTLWVMAEIGVTLEDIRAELEQRHASK
ncbi:MAG: bifunctional phosphoribosyl-AMP cyclohydrolase/phosphoribosyl-ATP diphosphatase HisIE [Deinococcales bacterium]